GRFCLAKLGHLFVWRSGQAHVGWGMRVRDTHVPSLLFGHQASGRPAPTQEAGSEARFGRAGGEPELMPLNRALTAGDGRQTILPANIMRAKLVLLFGSLIATLAGAQSIDSKPGDVVFEKYHPL